MSTFHREFTDSALTGTLDHWLDEGPTSAPDFTVEAALRTVATTRQRQLRGRLLQMADFHGPALPVGLTVAGITAIVLVAVGLGMNNGAVPGVDGTPGPEASEESAAPSDLPYGWVRYRNEADGYELVVPGTFQVLVEPAYGEPHDGVTRFGSDVAGNSGAALNVTVGSPGGSIYLCEGAACHPVVAASTEELEGAIQARWPPIEVAGERIGERIVATTLGGEAARLRYPTIDGSGSWGFPGANQACSAYAMRGARPVTLTVPCNEFTAGIPNNLSTLERIVDSFRFTDAAPLGSQRMSFPEAGFAVTVQRGSWVDDFGDPYSRHINSPSGGLSVRTGDEQDRVRTFLRVAEPPLIEPSVEDLIGLVAREYQDLRGLAPEVSKEPIDLAGTLATWVTLTAPLGESSPGLIEFGSRAQHVVAVHDGRPFILTWFRYFDEGYERSFRNILATFQFLD